MAEPDPMVQLEGAIMAALGATTSQVSTDAALAALVPGGVHSRSAATGDIYPVLFMGLVRMDTDYTFRGPYRHQFRYSITVSDESESIDAASAALQRVFQLLQDAALTMEDFTLGFCRRYGRTQISPVTDGVTYQRISDEWRIEVMPV